MLKLTEQIFLTKLNINWQKPFKELSPSAFGIWLWLQENNINKFSPTNIAATGLMTKGTASKAMTELKQKGYVVEINE